MLAALLLTTAAATAGASALRTAALADVPWIVDDETNELSPANLGNPAGMAWLPRGVRLDEALARDISDQEHTSVVGKLTRADTAWRLGTPAGPYEALTWSGARNAWQLGLDGGADVTVTGLQPVGQKETQSATTFFAAEGRFLGAYARKVTDTLALGGWLRPLGGALGVPSFGRVAERTIGFSLSDYGLGAALRFPPRPGRGEGFVGLSFTPFNDRLDLRDAVGLAIGSSDALTDVGAYHVTQTMTLTDGSTQTWETTPEGTTLALQAGWRLDDGRWEAAAALDGTSARATQKNTTTLPAGGPIPAGTSIVQGPAVASEFARTRWRLEGRRRQDLASGGAVRYALALFGARSTASKLDFPSSEAVTDTRTFSPLEGRAGVSWQTAGGHTVGAGLTGLRETQAADDLAGALGLPVARSRGTATHTATTLRLGWEYLFTPHWTGRLGVAAVTERTRGSDPSAPPPGSAPANPVRTDRLLSAGAAYRTVKHLELEITLITHALGQTPEPAQGQSLRRTRDELLVGGRWSF